MKPQTVFIQVPVEERLPDEKVWHFILNEKYELEVGFVSDGKLKCWDDELKPSHWLEKKEDVYVFSGKELYQLLSDGFVAGRSKQRFENFFEEWKQINLK